MESIPQLKRVFHPNALREYIESSIEAMFPDRKKEKYNHAEKDFTFLKSKALDDSEKNFKYELLYKRLFHFSKDTSQFLYRFHDEKFEAFTEESIQFNVSVRQ
ncbi:MAG: hypothetical protein ACLTSS_04905 [Phocaeicola coprocola]